MTINWSNFVYLLVVPWFFNLPLEFLWSIAVRSPHRMDAPERHNGQRDKRTKGRTDGRTKRRVSLSVRPSVCQKEFDTQLLQSTKCARSVGAWASSRSTNCTILYTVGLLYVCTSCMHRLLMQGLTCIQSTPLFTCNPLPSLYHPLQWRSLSVYKVFLRGGTKSSSLGNYARVLCNAGLTERSFPYRPRHFFSNKSPFPV